jgi:predicted ATP-grasp superfamily ATP-dependent carboligase
MNILVTDGKSRAALAVTRSLGRKGCNVIVTGAAKGNIAAASRFCQKSYATSSAMGGARKFTEEIASIVAKEKIHAIFPITEQSILQLNKVRDQLPGNPVLACAVSEQMEAVSNKYSLFQMAQSIGVPIPETVFVEGFEDFVAKEPGISDFPAVVKPAFSKIPDGDRLIPATVMYAPDRTELTRLYESKPVLGYPSLIQERIVGEGTGLFTLFDGDRHQVLFAHRRLLEKPPSGGVSVVCESVALDPDMVESAKKLLAAVGWRGVAMVEFKRDIRDRRAKLMEINGRFWGSLQLAISAGVDFPALCLDYWFDRKPAAPLVDYRIGHRLKWFFGILDHLIIRLKDRSRLGKECFGIPSLWRVARELFAVGDGTTSFDVLDPSDLRPFLAEVMSYGKALFYRDGRIKA